MVLSLAFIIGIAQLLQLSYSDCVYTDSGQTMYLTQLAHSVLTYNNTDENYIYTFTPCRNEAAVCDNPNGGSDTSMCSQTQGDECKVIANWDASATATFSAQTGPGRWSITYYGNPCDGGGDIKMDATFLCNETAADYHVITAYGVDDCYYEFQVATKWACPGEVPPETEDNSLSGGSIFVIILISGFFAYFVFGWITCAFLNRKDRGCTDICGNVPHATFWIKLPSLVCAGCCFTKDFLFGLCSKDGGSSTNTNAQIKGNGAAYETIDD